ncbi:hypothetical protein AB5J62_19440 [Amycolatopsis sp. cg5]|uniref:hypothetical protein n=1 Tax=Amycolatopsis sp. cg5 TaxID=3238802 RepID=UPI0035250EF2
MLFWQLVPRVVQPRQPRLTRTPPLPLQTRQPSTRRLPKDALSKILGAWKSGVANKKKEGFRWFDPNPNAEGIRIDKGNSMGLPSQ